MDRHLRTEHNVSDVSLIRNHTGAQHCTGIQQALERRRVQFRAEHTTKKKKKNPSSFFLTDSCFFYPTVILVELNAHSITGKAPNASVFICHYLNIITSQPDSLWFNGYRVLYILRYRLYMLTTNHSAVFLNLVKKSKASFSAWLIMFNAICKGKHCSLTMTVFWL